MILLIASILFFAINLIHLNKMFILTVMEDEFGYWSNAAFFAGYDWSEALKGTAYYSYGQGFILSIFMRVFEDPVLIYRCAIVYNAFLVSIMLFFIYYVVSKVLSELSKEICIVLTCLCVCLPLAISNVQISWPEITIQFCFWVIVFFILKIEEKEERPKEQMPYICALPIISVYLYTLHQRTIGVIVALCIIMLLFYITKKVKFSHVLLFFTILFIFFFCSMLLKRYIQSNVWIYAAKDNANDYVAQLNKVIALFTIDGLNRFFHDFIGHLFYVGANSFLFVYIAFFYFIQKIFLFIKSRGKMLGGYPVLKLFFLLSFLFMIGISSLFMMQHSRIDHVIYGRYSEFTTMPFLVLGIGSFFIEKNEKKEIWFYMVSVFLFIIFMLITKSYLDSANLGGFVLENVPSITMFVANKKEILYIPLFVTTVGLFTAFFIMKRIGSKKLFLYGILFFMGIVMFGNGQLCIRREPLLDQDYLRKVYALVEKIPDSEEPLYYKLTNSWHEFNVKGFFQFALQDKPLISYYPEEIPQMKEKYVISTTFDPFFSAPGDNYKVAEIEDRLRLWEYDPDYNSREGETQRYIFSLEEFRSQNRDETKETYESNGSRGYFTYGPYMNLGKGNYTLTVQTTIKDKMEDNIGFIEVIGQSGVLKNMDLKSEDIKNGTMVSALKFSIADIESSIQIRILLNEGSIVQLDSVVLEKSPYTYYEDLRSKMSVKTDTNEQSIYLDGSDNAILFGPYISLAKGSYTVTFDVLPLELDLNGGSYLFDIAVNSGVSMIQKEFTNADFSVSEVTRVEIPFDLNEDKKDVEFRLFLKNTKSKFLIKNVEIKENQEVSHEINNTDTLFE